MFENFPDEVVQLCLPRIYELLVNSAELRRRVKIFYISKQHCWSLYSTKETEFFSWNVKHRYKNLNIRVQDCDTIGDTLYPVCDSN